MYNDISKKYSLDIDFLNYENKKDVTKNIVYSQGDVGTAFIHATLSIGSKIINLDNCTVTVNIKNSDGSGVVNYCEVLDVEKGLIMIPFTSTALSSSGFNKFEVVITSNNKQIVSPVFSYRVVENISDEDSIEGTDEYSVLVVLIKQVEDILKDTKETEVRVNNLEETLTVNENIRKENEADRISNENLRKAQESVRQDIFDAKISAIDDRIDLVDRKLISVDEIIANKLIEVDKDVRDIINTKFDNKVIEIEKEIDITINQIADESFTNANNKINEKIDEMSVSINNVNSKIQEMDSTIDENVNKVNNKITEFTSTKNELVNTINTTLDNKVSEVDTAKSNLINTVNNTLSSKIVEFNETKEVLSDIVDDKIVEIDTKVNNKITEVDITKNNLVTTVNSKITEVNEVKDNLVTTVGNKLDEFEDRFITLESGNVAGEVSQARQDMNGTTHLTIGDRLNADFSKKADASNVYSKIEMDKIIEDFTLVDDSVTNDKNTWSSEKIEDSLNTIKTNAESSYLANANNILRLQEQLSDSITFLSEFINVIKGKPTLYNLNELSKGINDIKDSLDNEIQNKKND